MGNGLVAEWQRGLVGRGVAAAILLALPVGVAAVIGFSSSATGLSEGLGSLVSGPDQIPAQPARGDSLDTAIASVGAPATSAAPDTTGAGTGAGPDGAGTAPGGGVGGGVGGGGGGAGGGGGPGGATPVGGQGGGQGGPVGLGPGGVTDAVPVSGGPVDQVLGGLDETLNGLLGVP